MNRLSLVLVLTLASIPVLRAQNRSPQGPPGPRADCQGNMPDPMQAHVMEMHQHEMEAMRADVQTMKLSLATIKANIPQISDSAEKARWQSNVDLWQVMLTHMDKMLGHMDSVSPGQRGHGPAHDNTGDGPAPAQRKRG